MSSIRVAANVAFTVFVAAGCSSEGSTTDAPAFVPGQAGTGLPSAGAAGRGALPAAASAGKAGASIPPNAANASGVAGSYTASAGVAGSLVPSMAGAGAGAAAGAGAPSVAAGTGGASGAGEPELGKCCADGDCLCHGDAPTELSVRPGPYKTATLMLPEGTVVYPTDAEPPFASVALCGGFTNTGPEMADWGPFYGSYGIVTIITTTLGTDTPDIRATKLLAAITALKSEGTKSGSPLNGKLSDRYGTSGYSMGGGGTTLASADMPMLKTSVGLAAWGGNGASVNVPTLLLCGASDTTAPCSMTQGVYTAIPDSTPKMMISIPGATHFSWFGPTGAGNGVSGEYALAFQKVFLEGDSRWESLLLNDPPSGTATTNIEP